jgi:Fanconi anemia group J protein
MQEEIASRSVKSGPLFDRPVFWEQYKDKVQFDNDLREYVKAAQAKQGAIMMAVCRGKLSEGYNFENNLARAVLIVGYPLIDFNCLEYRLQEHMNEKGIKEWYYTHAAEAINQAAGRLIRSLKDFGCLYLIG